MPKEIVIVGGLLDSPSAASLLVRLKAEVSAEFIWQWLHCGIENNYQPPDSATKRIISGIVQRKAQADAAKQVSEIYVVKLFDLHPRTTAILYQYWEDPITAPVDARTADALIAWLVSPTSNLFPRTEWNAGPVGAALMAILSKLIANSAFSSSVANHKWVKENDLLTQSPVDRPGFSPILKEARKMLSSLDGKLLLTKGSGQGNTPKEWAIDTAGLPAIKRCVLDRSFAPLKDIIGISGLLAKIEAEDKVFDLYDGIISERVRAKCRERHLAKALQDDP